jgi:putative peptidoglycan lipid II flippase
LGWPAEGVASDNLRSVVPRYVPAAGAALLASSSLVIDQSMAASLAAGNVSVLNYGNKIVALVLSVVAVSLTTALFPRISRMIVEGRYDALNRAIHRYTAAILVASVPVVAGLVMASEPLLRFIFERGAFTHQTTLAVNEVQLWYLPQIPFAILTMLGYRMLSSLDGNAIVLRIGVLNLALNVAGNVFFMRHYGVRGIAMSTSLVFFVAAMVTLVAIKIKLAEARHRQTTGNEAC